MGGSKRAHAYAKHLGCEMVICYKHRKKANEIGDMRVIGEVEGRNIVLVDDMVDTAGTLTTAADMMLKARSTCRFERFVRTLFCRAKPTSAWKTQKCLS